MQGLLPETGFVRMRQIVGDPGDPNAKPPRPAVPGVLPISRSAWWAGVKEGRYPGAVKLGTKTTAWRVEDIKKLIADLGAKS